MPAWMSSIRAIASMSGSTSQPNLNSIVAALQHTPRDTGLDRDALNEFSDYWEQVREYLRAVRHRAKRTAAPKFICTKCPAASTRISRSRPPSMGVGHRWPEIARTYAEVNQLFGDIVKVTPSSKVVGDMCHVFLITRGMKPADVAQLPRKPVPPAPASPRVSSTCSRRPGPADGGWACTVQKFVLGSKKPFTHRPGERAGKIDLDKVRLEVAKVVGSARSSETIFIRTLCIRRSSRTSSNSGGRTATSA